MAHLLINLLKPMQQSQLVDGKTGKLIGSNASNASGTDRNNHDQLFDADNSEYSNQNYDTVPLPQSVLFHQQQLNKRSETSKPAYTLLPTVSFNPYAIPSLSTGKDYREFLKQKLDRMYKFPASYKQAMLHKQANKFGYKNAKIKIDPNQILNLQVIESQKTIEQNQSQKSTKKYYKVPVCPCCQNIIVNREIQLSYSTSPQEPKGGQPKFLLQTGVSMYFLFIKTVILYLLLRFLVFDITNIYLSLSGNYCSGQFQKDECTFTTLSGYNLNSRFDTKSLQTLNMLSLVLTALSIIYFVCCKYYQAIILKRLSKINKSETDYSILIQQIPLFISSKQELEDQIEEVLQKWIFITLLNQNWQPQQNKIQYHFYQKVYKRKLVDFQAKYPGILNRDQQVKKIIKEQTNKVSSIQLCCDLTQLQTISKIRDQLVKNYIKQNQGKNLDETPSKRGYHSRLQIQIKRLNQIYSNFSASFATNQAPQFSVPHFTGKAIVSFHYKHYRDLLLRKYDQDSDFLHMGGKSLRISLTNKPEDIYWYNMKVTDAERSKFRFYSNVVLFLLLVVSFASLIGLQYLQGHTELPVNSKALIDQIKSRLFSVAMAILTNVINFILSYSMEILADAEKYKTKSGRLSSLVIKIIVTQTINTAFIYYTLWLMSPSNPLGKTGLYKNVFDLVLVSGFIGVFLQMFPPIYLVKKWINNYKYKDKELINMFQVQLNQILQQPEFNFAFMYAFYIVFTFVVSFYGFIAPITTPILICIFAIQFWVDKYNLFKRFSCPVDFGVELIKKIFTIFETSILLFVIGHLMWDWKINKDESTQYRVISIANIVIAILFVTFELGASDRLKKWIFPFQEDQFDPFSSYTKQWLQNKNFGKNFCRKNPAYNFLGINDSQNQLYPKFFPEDQAIIQKCLNLKKQQLVEQFYRDQNRPLNIEKVEAQESKKTVQTKLTNQASNRKYKLQSVSAY